jgi:acetylornithine/succinyldiaminopimelate/putrescine aminotransferase
MSLADLLGKKYTDRVVAANAALGVMTKEEALAIAEEKIDFFPEDAQARNSKLLSLVGKQIIEPLGDSTDGAPTDAFRKAENKDAAPVGANGNFRVGEDGKLYFIGKSEHYHASLGHSFPGYKLIDRARALGIPNATHNNTRGYVTRLCEEKLVASANGIDWADEEAIAKVVSSTEHKVLNRVINLETGSLAAEAGFKMMLARFYKLSPEFPAPKYEGKTPVFFVLGDYAGGIAANYHGTTTLIQTFRGLWADLKEKAEAAELYKVVPVSINDVADFEEKIKLYNQGNYKTAGFMHEIVLMNYGGIRLTEEFLKRAYELCEEYDTPTMVDEIQSCMWYDGMFQFRLYGLEPDFVIIGKGFPGGEYPASKVITTAEYDNLNQFGALVTNGQEELASLAYLVTMTFALANRSKIAEIGAYFEERLGALCNKYPEKLTKVEGAGLLAAIHCKDIDSAKAFMNALHDSCIDASAQIYKQNCLPAVLFKPSLISDKDALDLIADTIDEILAK